MEKEEILQKCRIEGNIVKLPDMQLDRALYLEVSKALNLIGGVWKGGKTAGFVFQEEPTNLLSQVSNGNNVNLKKEYQFFATPDAIADELVIYAEIDPSHKILEPSAGQGAIINAIHRLYENVVVDYCELMPLNQTFLEKLNNVNMVGEDFLNINCLGYYDRIIANPPFNKNQDITHIRKMYDCLKPGGRLVSIASKHWLKSSNKKEVEFRNWLKKLGAVIHNVDAGMFKESGTMVETCIIIINKNGI